MTETELKVPFAAPLNEKDTEIQTYGCRANNSDIFANISAPGICAFITEVIYAIILQKLGRSNIIS